MIDKAENDSDSPRIESVEVNDADLEEVAGGVGDSYMGLDDFMKDQINK